MLLTIVVLAAAAAVLGALLLTRHHGSRVTAPATVYVTTAATRTAPHPKPRQLVLPVPDLVGRPGTDAAAGLRRAGFRVVLVSVPSALPAGAVTAQHPAGGSRAPAGSGVRLNVSAGAPTPTTTSQEPAAAPVPSLSGELQPAVQRLDRAGFVASVAYVPADTPLGTVVAQSPDGGASAPARSQVTVNVSSGPGGNPPETVPDVVGQRIPQAVSTLNGAGLRLIFLRAPVADQARAGAVVAQTPQPGKQAPRNAQVLVYMGAYRR